MYCSLHTFTPGRCPGLWAAVGLSARLNHFMIKLFSIIHNQREFIGSAGHGIAGNDLIVRAEGIDEFGACLPADAARGKLPVEAEARVGVGRQERAGGMRGGGPARGGKREVRHAVHPRVFPGNRSRPAVQRRVGQLLAEGAAVGRVSSVGDVCERIVRGQAQQVACGAAIGSLERGIQSEPAHRAEVHRFPAKQSDGNAHDAVGGAVDVGIGCELQREAAAAGKGVEREASPTLPHRFGTQRLRAEVVEIRLRESRCPKCFAVVSPEAQGGAAAPRGFAAQHAPHSAHRGREATHAPRRTGGVVLDFVVDKARHGAGCQREAVGMEAHGGALQERVAQHVVVRFQIAPHRAERVVGGKGKRPFVQMERRAGGGVGLLLHVALRKAAAGILRVDVAVVRKQVGIFAGGKHLHPIACKELSPRGLGKGRALAQMLVVLVRVKNYLSGEFSPAFVEIALCEPSAAARSGKRECRLASAGVHKAVGAAFAVRGDAVVDEKRIVVAGVEIVCPHIPCAALPYPAACAERRIDHAERALTQGGGDGGTALRRIGKQGSEFHHGGGNVAHGAEQSRRAAGAEGDRGEAVDVECLEVSFALSGIRHGEAVVSHGRMCRPQSAHAHRFQSARAAVVAQVDARHAAQGIARVGDAASAQRSGIDFLIRRVARKRFLSKRSRYGGGGKSLFGRRLRCGARRAGTP